MVRKMLDLETLFRKSRSQRAQSEVFDAVVHLIRIKYLPDQHEGTNDVAQRVTLRVTVGNPSVLDTSRVEPQEVGVLREDDAQFRQGERHMAFVRRAQQADVGRRRGVDPAIPERSSDARVAVLIQVEANRPRHGVGPVFFRRATGRPRHAAG